EYAKFIETVRGHGYRFLPTVRRIEVKPENDDADRAPLAKQSEVVTGFPIADRNYERPRSGKVVALTKWRREETSDSAENGANEVSEPQTSDARPAKPATTKQPAQDRSDAVTSSGYQRLQPEVPHLRLDSRSNKRRYFLAVEAFVVLLIAGF